MQHRLDDPDTHPLARTSDLRPAIQSRTHGGTLNGIAISPSRQPVESPVPRGPVDVLAPARDFLTLLLPAYREYEHKHENEHIYAYPPSRLIPVQIRRAPLLLIDILRDRRPAIVINVVPLQALSTPLQPLPNLRFADSRLGYGFSRTQPS
ncbi:hypothetical protein D9615_009831 [Tricholomella constricta]|uniref:Uncharacterized protein n=1 Tax=Tricholomella constricta TaxID=117010 RepID=A0A8H5LWK0_9AGAR|nr:hypothetical protein D9615_009831 [Tricholomella constricta]